MVPRKPKVHRNRLTMSQVQIPVRLRWETRNDRLHRALTEDISQEALLEHGIRVERGFLLLRGLRSGRLGLWCSGLRVCLCGGLRGFLRALLGALLQLVL